MEIKSQATDCKHLYWVRLGWGSLPSQHMGHSQFAIATLCLSLHPLLSLLLSQSHFGVGMEPHHTILALHTLTGRYEEHLSALSCKCPANRESCASPSAVPGLGLPPALPSCIVLLWESR